MGFIEHRKAIMDPVLADEAGEAWSEGLGANQDEELERMKTAALASLPVRCPDDALPVVGEAYGLERYAGVSNAGYRAQLQAAFPTRREQGAATSIEKQIRAAFGCDVRVYADFEGTFWPPGEWYSRFRVRIGPNLGTLTTTSFVIGEGIIGSTPIGGPHIDATQRRALKRIILRWKSVHAYATDILVWISGGPPIGEGAIGSMVIGGQAEQIWLGRLIGKNIVIGSTPIGGYDRS